MARVAESALALRRYQAQLQRERRQSERAVAYWEQKAAQFGSRPTLIQLEPGEGIEDGNWSHRFVIAPDRVPKASTFLMCGSSAARLLELSEGPLQYELMFRQMPRKFLQIFTWGCNNALESGSPTRLAGALDREDGRRELYRAVFIPVGLNLVFGAFNSTLSKPQGGSPRRLEDRFVDEIVSVIREIRAESTISLGGIAAALNARGLRTIRGRNLDFGNGSKSAAPPGGIARSDLLR
jgi:hypothetical protein